MPFRCNAKNVFLTYPRCTLTKDELLQGIIAALPPNRLEWAVVCVEHHEDGTPHLHASLGFTSKLDIRNEAKFDIAGFHPNIQPTSSVDNANKYLEKEDNDVLRYGNVPEPGTKKRKIDYGAVIDSSSSSTEFIANLERVDPRMVITSFSSVLAFAQHRFKPCEIVYESPYTIADFPFVPPEFTDWISEYFVQPRKPRPLSMVLIGPTRCGKTALARSLGRHMYFNTMVDFKNGWDDSVEYAIFDDFGFEFIPNKKCFFGAQDEFAITDKYSGKRSVKWGKPSIFLINEPYVWPEDFYKKNTVVINLYDYFSNKPYKKLY